MCLALTQADVRQWGIGLPLVILRFIIWCLLVAEITGLETVFLSITYSHEPVVYYIRRSELVPDVYEIRSSWYILVHLSFPYLFLSTTENRKLFWPFDQNSTVYFQRPT